MRYEGRRMKAEGGKYSRRRACALSSFILQPSSLRHAVTLIELLVTITIIAVLSATFLGASRLAMESAREARTKTTIGKIHRLLMEKWNSYATRRVDVDPALTQALRNNLLPAGTTGPAASQARRLLGMANADLRLLATRELMKLEMPDRWSDVLLNGVLDSNPITSVSRSPSILGALPAITSTYRRRFYSLQSQDNTPLDGLRVVQNQSAECLYMTIMLSTGEGEARTLFSEQDIGDTDGDGAPEFLDGWGNPIQFMRWPAGFWQRSDLMGGPLLADQDHDSFDVFRRDAEGVTVPVAAAYPSLGVPTVQQHINQLRLRNNSTVLRLPDGSMSSVSAFRLVPLIYSTGPDGVSDMNSSPRALVNLDPYEIDGNDPVFQFGNPFDGNNDGDDNSLDNIHNHLQDNR